jgi:hemolysin activation/secretion protein
MRRSTPKSTGALCAAPLALAAMIAGASPAAAQAARELLPPPTDPLAERFERVQAPEERGDAARAAVAAGGPAFRLEQVVVEGAGAIAPEALRPIWEDLLGGPVTLPELEAIAAAIGARYRDEGFVLSQAVVPAQTVENGVVRIQVVEGFVDRVDVEGARVPAAAWAERRFGLVAEGRPLDIAALERAVLISRDTLGGGVETVLAPSPETLAAADLTVLVEPRPVSGFAALDTRGSRLYSDVTATAGATFFGALGGTERLDILASGDPLDSRLGYLRGDGALPLAGLDGGPLDGATFGVRFDASRGRPSSVVEGLRLITDEVGVGVQLAVPFVRSRAGNAFGRLGLDWRRSDTVTRFGADETSLRDTLLALEVGASLDRADRAGGVSIVDVTLRQGIDAGGVGISASGPATATESFTRAFGRLARLQRLGDDWTLFAEALWQVAGNILPDAERFSLGGSTIGRGFAPGNTTGDSGYGLRLELRRQVDLGAEGRAAEIYGYGDGGRARDRSEARDGDRWESLASVGIGARIDLTPNVTLTPEIAQQIEGRPSDRPGRSGGETRGFIGVVARF